VKIDTHRQ